MPYRVLGDRSFGGFGHGRCSVQRGAAHSPCARLPRWPVGPPIPNPWHCLPSRGLPSTLAAHRPQDSAPPVFKPEPVEVHKTLTLRSGANRRLVWLLAGRYQPTPTLACILVPAGPGRAPNVAVLSGSRAVPKCADFFSFFWPQDQPPIPGSVAAQPPPVEAQLPSVTAQAASVTAQPPSVGGQPPSVTARPPSVKAQPTSPVVPVPFQLGPWCTPKSRALGFSFFRVRDPPE